MDDLGENKTFWGGSGKGFYVSPGFGCFPGLYASREIATGIRPFWGRFYVSREIVKGILRLSRIQPFWGGDSTRHEIL